MNATWWVHYTDQNGNRRLLELSSPDLRDAKEAHKRARETAKKRLMARGVKATDLESQCVG